MAVGSKEVGLPRSATHIESEGMPDEAVQTSVESMHNCVQAVRAMLQSSMQSAFVSWSVEVFDDLIDLVREEESPQSQVLSR